jgi:hypothetical protein
MVGSALKQQTIFDQVDEAELAKQRGMELVYRHADSVWKRRASEVILRVASRQHELTSDDIIIPLEREGVVTGDLRALGMIMQCAARMGILQSAERWIPCRRKQRHKAPVQVWQSKIYKVGR